MKFKNARIQYYLEGKCEKKLVKTLIEQRPLLPGQTDVLNPIQEIIKPTHLRKFSSKAVIILIFDTDKPETGILERNLQFLTSSSSIQKVITIPQANNLEEELIKCTNIRHIRELINCSHDSDFKSGFIEERHLYTKLQAHQFDIQELWSFEPHQIFLDLGIQNQSDLIKLKRGPYNRKI